MNKKQIAIGCTWTQEDCATPSHKHSNEASSLEFLPFFSGTAKIIMNRVNVITLRRGNAAKKIERKEAEEKGSHWPGKELQPAQQEMCTEHSKMNLTGLMCQDQSYYCLCFTEMAVGWLRARLTMNLKRGHGHNVRSEQTLRLTLQSSKVQN